MSKRSSIASKPLPLSDSKNNSSVAEEPGIQKHVKFWDKKNKGYITPLDTISGFITLGYSVIFSIVIGAFVGIFLSLSTQTGWFPDPLCRSNVRNLIRAKKQTQSNQGAFDANGVFVPEKFDSLFNKYAKSDKSGKTITVAELVRMTKEQERLGKDVKAWATSMVELCTAYFFIGHRGSLTKEDVRSAYDGTLFYRLKDAHRLMIKQTCAANIDSAGSGLVGSYLVSKHKVLSVKGIERRFQALLSALQSKSSAAVAEYRLRDWVSYIEESTNSIKKNAMPRVLMRSPSSAIKGVATPKTSIYRSAKQPEDPANLFPDGVTGVAKPHSDNLSIGSHFLNNLLQQHDGTNETTFKISNFDESYEHIIFPSLTEDENMLLAEAAKAARNASSSSSSSASYPTPVPKKSISSNTSYGPLMKGFLVSEDADALDWPGEGLTGVQGSNRNTNKSEKSPAPSVSSASSSKHSGSKHSIYHGEKGKMESVSSKKIPNIPAKQAPPPPPQQPPHMEEQMHQQQHIEVSKAAITPPPEEKTASYVDKVGATATQIANNNNKKSQTVNNKKVKRKNKKGNSSGQVSPIDSSESGQEQPSDPPIKHSVPIIDASCAIAADTK